MTAGCTGYPAGVEKIECWDWSTQYGCWKDLWCRRHGDYHPCTRPIVDEGLSLCADHAAELARLTEPA